ncbi:hypothetical protein FEM48_Zijuj09G0125400 [Ziziphus jujuba var. spinosa]|uniref:Uncharacterized protein n=1 Tax=Ziziphus jujuba var. spinosa TaxID=714518 RepID=A0A978UT11_ZIZJJ|nr:hypothetical protein FEM48_Zijuj09G0125400 [Ziziphus jujuba var. spinosa]
MASTPDLLSKFFKATTTLGTKLDQLLQQHRLDCLVADMLFPWATDVAARYGIPRLIFHGTCFFALCATVCVYRYAPHKDVTSDCDPFLIPNLPGLGSSGTTHANMINSSANSFGSIGNFQNTYHPVPILDNVSVNLSSFDEGLEQGLGNKSSLRCGYLNINSNTSPIPQVTSYNQFANSALKCDNKKAVEEGGEGHGAHKAEGMLGAGFLVSSAMVATMSKPPLRM